MTTEAETFYRDFAIAFACAGVVFFLLGMFIGRLIWKKTRRLAEEVESGNREALSEFEKTSDEMSRIKAGIKEAAE